MLITEEQLLEATGYQRRAYLRQYLKDKRIPFRVGKDGRIWTTEVRWTLY